MKKLNLKLLVLMLAMILSMAMMTACGSSEESEEGDASITVTDMMGNEVNLESAPEQIVVLTASDCEILYAIGAGETVVGRGEYCDYPEEVMEIATVKSGADTNLEEVIALDPDVVVMGTMAQTEDQIADLRDAGIEVYVSDSKTIDDTYENIGLLGELTGHVDEAATVVEDMKATFDEVEGMVEASDPAKTVYFEVSPLEFGLWAAGNDSFMNEIAVMLGVKNVFDDVSGFGEVSEEQVLERNPDLIVTTTMYFGEGPTPEEELLGRKGWGGIKAVKDSNVYNADSDKITRPGPRLADAAEDLYSFIYK